MYSFWTRKIIIISCVCYFCSYIIFKIPCIYNNSSYRQAIDHCRTMTCHLYSKLKNMMKLEQLLLKFIPIKIYVNFCSHLYGAGYFQMDREVQYHFLLGKATRWHVTISDNKVKKEKPTVTENQVNNQSPRFSDNTAIITY